MIVTRGLGPAPALATCGLGPLTLVDVILCLAGIMALSNTPAAVLTMGDIDGSLVVADR